MKNILSIKFLFIVLICSASAHAGLYKGLDADGNTAYADKPFTNAEEITPPSITIVDPVKAPAKEAIEESETEEFKYTQFSISSPTDQQTIRNEPSLTVLLNLKPALNTAESHTIWLFMDGKPIIKNSKSLALAVGRAERGEHQFQAHIRNKAGKVIKQTQAVTVNVKNTFIQRKAPE